jgi:hypothetical protein
MHGRMALLCERVICYFVVLAEWVYVAWVFDSSTMEEF